MVGEDKGGLEKKCKRRECSVRWVPHQMRIWIVKGRRMWGGIISTIIVFLTLYLCMCVYKWGHYAFYVKDMDTNIIKDKTNSNSINLTMSIHFSKLVVLWMYR